MNEWMNSKLLLCFWIEQKFVSRSNVISQSRKSVCLFVFLIQSVENCLFIFCREVTAMEKPKTHEFLYKRFQSGMFYFDMLKDFLIYVYRLLLLSRFWFHCSPLIINERHSPRHLSSSKSSSPSLLFTLGVSIKAINFEVQLQNNNKWIKAGILSNAKYVTTNIPNDRFSLGLHWALRRIYWGLLSISLNLIFFRLSCDQHLLLIVSLPDKF